MKKRGLFMSTLLLTALGSFSQNLVQNYSFEDTLKCITQGGQFNGYVANWTGQTSYGGLWYFTSQCAGDNNNLTNGAGVPYNYASGPLGFQYAHTGVSYAGIQNFVSGLPDDTTYPYGNTVYANARNYIESKLIKPMDSGVIYYVTFYASLANYCNYACSDIGACFTVSAFPLNGTTVIYGNPQVSNNAKKKELSDTMNWMKISGSFVAKGNEQYMTIGNFKNDSTSSIRYLGQISQYQGEAYYYIDDVIVSADSNYADSIMGVQPIGEQNRAGKVYPNPASTFLNVEVGLVNGQTGTICMYSSLGEKVICEEITQHFTILPINTLVPGIYFYRITDENGKLIKADKVMIVH
jgi:hypothetical protein